MKFTIRIVSWYWTCSLSKAFDSLDHSILLRKLSNFGISKPALFWFKIYLTGRSQSIRIASVLSDECEITRGVVK
jgi:hypothetical protein